jgi:tryptophan 2,3-dioxygenase
LRTGLKEGKTWAAVKTMKRVLTILKTMVAQIDIPEMMTPLEFESFRGFLDEASGFQSVQFCELEIDREHRSSFILKAHEDEHEYLQRLSSRMEENTLWESFRILLKKQNIMFSFVNVKMKSASCTTLRKNCTKPCCTS